MGRTTARDELTGIPMATVRCAQCATRTRCFVPNLGIRASAHLQPHITPMRFGRGEAISVEGELAASVRTIKVGTAMALRRAADGERKPVAFVGRGAPVAILGFFGLRNVTGVVATGVVHVCDVPIDRLRDEALADRRIERQLVERAGAVTSELADWSASLRQAGTVKQLAHVLLMVKRIDGTQVVELPSRQDLADLLGARRETVTRALGALERAGALRPLARRRWEVDDRRLGELLESSH